MRPRARREGLVVRELPGETVVYDRESHEAHCLDRTASAVFRAADGSRSLDEIAASLDAPAGVREEAALAAVAALDEAGLLEAPALDGPTRRASLRRGLTGLSLTAGLAFGGHPSLLPPCHRIRSRLSPALASSRMTGTTTRPCPGSMPFLPSSQRTLKRNCLKPMS